MDRKANLGTPESTEPLEHLGQEGCRVLMVVTAMDLLDPRE